MQDFGAGDDDEIGLASYQAQLSIGLHILVMMGTFFAAGFYGVSYLSPKPLHVGALPSQTPPCLETVKPADPTYACVMPCVMAAVS